MLPAFLVMFPYAYLPTLTCPCVYLLYFPNHCWSILCSDVCSWCCFWCNTRCLVWVEWHRRSWLILWSKSYNRVRPSNTYERS